MEIKEPMEERPIELGITKFHKDGIAINMTYLVNAMNELCGLVILSYTTRHLFWESKNLHEWHFIIETPSMKRAFSIYKEDAGEVVNDLRAMSLGLEFLVRFKSQSVVSGIESLAATNLLKMHDASGCDRMLYAINVDNKKRENGL